MSASLSIKALSCNDRWSMEQVTYAYEHQWFRHAMHEAAKMVFPRRRIFEMKRKSETLF